jgi:hypothetical protein
MTDRPERLTIEEKRQNIRSRCFETRVVGGRTVIVPNLEAMADMRNYPFTFRDELSRLHQIELALAGKRREYYHRGGFQIPLTVRDDRGTAERIARVNMEMFELYQLLRHDQETSYGQVLNGDSLDEFTSFDPLTYTPFDDEVLMVSAAPVPMMSRALTFSEPIDAIDFQVTAFRPVGHLAKV